ncbi:MAG: hypothetical protein GY888_26700, partial [Planctomycetaceae bacterium]|nr:hypothetical protein [Planctomycetaceae bacterium]
TGQSSLPLEGPLPWQLVDDAYRSHSTDDNAQLWLDPEQTADEETDWWDFLDQ